MDIEWRNSSKPVSYPEALVFMEERVAGIIAGKEPEMVWLLEHPPLYTAGTSAKKSDLLDGKRFPVYETGRGGEYTYHGPGQRVAYIMLNLKERGIMDVKKYVWSLEELIIRTLAEFGIKGERRQGRVGIWVAGAGLGNPASRQPAKPHSIENLGKFSGNEINSEVKIAAIGIRVRKWVTYHGLAININPDLSHFSGIIPCGIKEYGVTSFEKLGVKVKMKEVDESVENNFRHIF